MFASTSFNRSRFFILKNLSVIFHEFLKIIRKRHQKPSKYAVISAQKDLQKELFLAALRAFCLPGQQKTQRVPFLLVLALISGRGAVFGQILELICPIGLFLVKTQTSNPRSVSFCEMVFIGNWGVDLGQHFRLISLFGILVFD